MDDPDNDELTPFVRSLDQPTLSALLLELAAKDDAVRKRLDRLKLASQPRKLAAVFRKTLSTWQRSTGFISYRESRAFGAELQGWRDEVERELLPKAPALALELIESLIESDAAFFERADDSDGWIGDAIRSACTLWLRAAAQCEAPPDGWTKRVSQLYVADDYGAREELLRSASLLLDEPALRALVELFESDLMKAMHAGDQAGSLPSGVFGASGALRLLGDALRDPDVHVRAVLRYSPVPNPLQKAHFARSYLACERPTDALDWLDGDWAHHEDTRLRLLAEAYAQLQRGEECADIRRRLFEATGTVEDFRAFRASVAPESRNSAEVFARERAVGHPDSIAAANLFLEIGDADAAEAVLIAKFEALDRRDYLRLVPLAEAMEAGGRIRGATACYRALLLGILERAYVRAYVHGARYLAKLRNLALEVPDLHPLEAHASFEAAVRSKHARKVSFWKHVSDG